MFTTLASILIAGLLPAGCGEPLSTSDRDAIQAASAGWHEAYHAGDWAALATFYATDAVVMPPNQPAILGRENIRAWFQENESGFTIELEYLEVDGCGDLAYVRGNYRLTIPVVDGEPREDIGKLLDIRRRTSEGAWLVSVDMFSSDLPAGE